MTSASKYSSGMGLKLRETPSTYPDENSSGSVTRFYRNDGHQLFVTRSSFTDGLGVHSKPMPRELYEGSAEAIDDHELMREQQRFSSDGGAAGSFSVLFFIARRCRTETLRFVYERATHSRQG